MTDNKSNKNKSKKICILWFRKDLRISDNVAFYEATKEYDKILPLYILDEESEDQRTIGSASKWFLHHSLESFRDKLKKQYNIELVLRKGESKEIIESLIDEYSDIDAVYWNRLYEPFNLVRDQQIKDSLRDKNIKVKSFNSSLLVEPWQVKTKQGNFYKVYTPFYKTSRDCKFRDIYQAPDKGNYNSGLNAKGDNIEDWNFIPKNPDWSKEFDFYWDNISEDHAQNRLYYFLDNKVNDYADKRNRPDLDFTSLLSPYLHYGLISTRQIHSVTSSYYERDKISEKQYDKFISEIFWREFSYNLIYNFAKDGESEDLKIDSKYKKFHEDNFNSKFDNFPWKENSEFLKRWQKGETGYPIVDAGMRQLWQTGWMHNRVRMIVGSFLVKNLLIDWREGEKWFWDCLVDADYANNTASWQWVAGCGADAAPYFRIFNPVTQGEKFDPEGIYVKKWIPELENLEKKYIHRPWEAKDDLLEKAKLKLGENYPKPIVDLKESRNKALEAYGEIKS
jgi:deoxyribodipyrimidine photo-lyase